MLDSGQLATYIDDYAVTGLTSNPSIFDKAIASGGYDDAIRKKAATGIDREALFFELAIEDLRRAADAFAPVHARTAGLDGWVSLEVSPLLADDAETTVRVAAALHAAAERPNLLIKIPGTPEGSPAVEEAVAGGIPVNVTLLFSADQYRAAADAFMRGIERRIAAGQAPMVGSVASVFMSRWDVAVNDQVPASPARPARARGRTAGLPRLSGDHGRRALAAPRERRGTHAAAAVGVDQHEGPGGAGRPVRVLLGRAVHGEHDARGHAARLLRPRARPHADARRRRRVGGHARRLRTRRASTSTRWPASCSARARPASSTPGTT